MIVQPMHLCCRCTFAMSNPSKVQQELNVSNDSGGIGDQSFQGRRRRRRRRRQLGRHGVLLMLMLLLLLLLL